jgi:hypothetical protein
MPPAFVPDTGEIDSHGWILDADQLSVPPPLFPTVMVCAAGLEAPEVAEKVIVPGDVVRAGVGGGVPVTMKVTGIDPLEGLAPGALTVMASV